MLRNYLTTAVRNLLREKGNTLLNILGLSLGITGTIVLFLIVKHGTSFDTYHTNHKRTYRVVSKLKQSNGYAFTQAIPAPLPDAFRNDFSNEVETVAFTSYRRGSLITTITNGVVKKYEEAKGVAFTEPSFFKIFDRKILIGFADKGLDQPHEAIISSKWAIKYFDKEDAVGEHLEYDHKEYVITSVMEDYPTNTDLPFDLLLSHVTIKKELDARGWSDFSDNDNCYVLMKENESVPVTESDLSFFAKKYSGDNSTNQSNNLFILQPLKDIHSDNRFGNYNTRLPKEAQIVFSVIAFFLLITACINFVNLSTAQAIKHTREVGIRKVMGSTRRQLIFQFICEAFIVTVFSVALSLLGSHAMLKFINPFMELSLALNLTSDGIVWLFLVVLILTVTLFAGFYPAWMVSSHQPVLALKNQTSTNASSGYSMRKGLIVVQFFISQVFIIATIVIVRQMEFMHQHDVGFLRDSIITVPIPSEADTLDLRGDNMRSLKTELLMLPGIEKASLNSAPPSYKAVYGTTFSLDGSAEEHEVQVKQVDGDYIDLYQFKIVAGGKLADRDTLSGLVVNEKLVRVAGFKSNNEIIGTRISFWGKSVPVVGVVNDFNTTSLERAITPVVLVNNINGYQSISLKLNPSQMQRTIKQVENKWKAVYPEYIFSYAFVEDTVRELYKGETRIAVLLSIFASIAIFISCLGLFGLVTFMANQKTKEIGVRKVLGASVANIMFLFAMQFVKLIAISFVLAVIPVWFLMNKLLEEFAYKITLGPDIFLMGFAVTFLLALLTAGFRSFSASIANPIRSLRSE